MIHLDHASTSSLAEFPPSLPTQLPAYIRLPRAGCRCPYTGLSRTTLNELSIPSPANDFAPPVVSHVLKIRGLATRGVRLIDLNSLLNHIASLAA